MVDTSIIMILNVNPAHVIESHDLELPTERHPAIESIIEELEEYMNCIS